MLSKIQTGSKHGKGNFSKILFSIELKLWKNIICFPFDSTLTFSVDDVNVIMKKLWNF